MPVGMPSKRWLAGIGAGSMLLLGGIIAGPLGTFAEGASQQTTSPNPIVSSQQSAETNDHETDDAVSASIQAQAKLTPDQAKQAAVNAHPGTTATQVSLDDENGTAVYSVTLSNGDEVKVDAASGTVLGTEPADTGNDGSGQDAPGADQNDQTQQQ